MIRKDTTRLVLAANCSLLAILLATRANAVMITHNSSTVLFADNFETASAGGAWDNGALPGSWTAAINNTVTNAALPGPVEGAQYGFVSRDGSGQGIRAQFDAVSTGRLDLNTMVFIPNDQQWLTIALGNSLGNNPGTPSGSVHSYVTFHLNSTHEVEDGALGTFPKMGFLYKNGEWMKLHIGNDFDNPAGGYKVDLTTTDGTFNYTRDVINVGAPINTMLIKFEANGNSAYFDAVVPEPATASLACFCAILVGTLFRRRCH